MVEKKSTDANSASTATVSPSEFMTGVLGVRLELWQAQLLEKSWMMSPEELHSITLPRDLRRIGQARKMCNGRPLSVAMHFSKRGLEGDDL